MANKSNTAASKKSKIAAVNVPAVPIPMIQISLEHARKICQKPGVIVHWRPQISLPEHLQYCLTPDVRI